jgi:predicted SprT family Zn-dependent metalloprotease
VLTWPAYESFSRAEWRGTLRHELIHVEQFQRTGTTGHGVDFRERAAELDAPASCPAFAEPTYLVRCGECDEVVARRFRASRLVEEPEAYRSSCCEAPLSVESP